MSDIQRKHTNARMSKIVQHGGLIYLCGQTSNGSSAAGIGAQTQEALSRIDVLLAEAGSDRSRLLAVTVHLKSMQDFAQMNACWESWLAGAAAPVPKEETPFTRFRKAFFEDKVAVAGLILFSIIVALALLAPLITPQNPYDLRSVDLMDSRLKPGSVAGEGFTTWLGTDGVGRDLYSGILYGLRISLMVGFLSGLIAASIGMAVGLIAAYAGGRVETILMRIVDLQLSLPAVLIALILVAALGKGVDKIIIALVVVQWAYYARTVRASALVERRKEYVEAAQSLGLSTRAIVFRHISCRNMHE
jgi:peptide/nickel transport system permease protein